MTTPLALASVTPEVVARLGGKAFNTWRLLSRVRSADTDVKVPESFVVLDLQSVGPVVGTTALPPYPLMVRSSSSKEDDGDSSFSGLLTSIPVNGLTEFEQAIAALSAEATERDAHPVSALIQPVVEFETGFTVGVVGTSAGPRVARVEHARAVVPVESAPAGWLMFEVSSGQQEAGAAFWELEDELNSLDDSRDLVASARALLGVASLEWPECEATEWYMEIEGGASSSGQVWCFQTRFDLVHIPSWAMRSKVLVRFGADRNFPAPVSKLTASVLGPVLSRQFDAPIVLDEVAEIFVCRSTTAPPAAFRERCVAAVRSQGRMDLDTIADVAVELNALWRDVREHYHQVRLDGSLQGALTQLLSTQVVLSRYFESSWFRRAVGTELLSGELSSAATEVFLTSDHRSRLALELARESSVLFGPAEQQYLSVILFGDDSVGTPRLVESLGLSDHQVDTLVERFFGRPDLVDGRVLSWLHERFEGLDPVQGALCTSLWAQDFDNQIKDAGYYLANLSLSVIAANFGTDVSTLHHLSLAEIADACAMPNRSAQAVLTASLRRGSLFTPASSQPLDESTRTPVPVPVSLDNGSTRDTTVLEFVLVANLAQIADDVEAVRQQRVYVMAALSPLDAITLPAVHGLWLHGLGEMSHASHLLRSRADIGFLVLGHLRGANRIGYFNCQIVDGVLTRDQLGSEA